MRVILYLFGSTHVTHLRIALEPLTALRLHLRAWMRFERMQEFSANPLYGRAKFSTTQGEIKGPLGGLGPLGSLAPDAQVLLIPPEADTGTCSAE